MSRVSLIEQLYCEKKSPLEFNYDTLWAPRINMLLSDNDVMELYKIATSVKYAANISKKYELIDQVMNKRGFRKAHAGTNRVVYNFLEDTRFVAKIAIDKVGMKDNPAEFENQNHFKPFCCRIFEVDKTGVLAFVERVNPITSIEEFASVADDIYTLLITNILGKYILDDIGATRYQNYGIRRNFGPVILDFPYAYELDGKKLICNHIIKTAFGDTICGGEIDYDDGFDNIICTKCGRVFKARELQDNTDKRIKIILNDERSNGIMTRAYIMEGNKIIKDSKASSKTYVSKEQYNCLVNNVDLNEEKIVVNRTIHLKSKTKDQIIQDAYSQLIIDHFVNSSATQAKIVEVGSNKSKPDKAVEVESGKKINNVMTVDSIDEEPMKESIIVQSDVVETEEKNTEAHVDKETEEPEIIEPEDEIEAKAINTIMNCIYGIEVEEPDTTYADQEKEDNTSEDEEEISFEEYKVQTKSEKRYNKKRGKYSKFNKGMEDY